MLISACPCRRDPPQPEVLPGPLRLQPGALPWRRQHRRQEHEPVGPVQARPLDLRRTFNLCAVLRSFADPEFRRPAVASAPATRSPSASSGSHFRASSGRSSLRPSLRTPSISRSTTASLVARPSRSASASPPATRTCPPFSMPPRATPSKRSTSTKSRSIAISCAQVLTLRVTHIGLLVC